MGGFLYLEELARSWLLDPALKVALGNAGACGGREFFADRSVSKNFCPRLLAGGRFP